MYVFSAVVLWMLTDKYATLDFRGLGYLRVNGRQGLPREVQQDGLAHLPGLHNQVFSVVLYIYHTYARFLAVRYVIFRSFTKMRSWTENFSSWASWPKADHDASRGSPSGLPGGLCASSVIILPLDPHLVDASVNFEDLGYIQL